MMMNFQQNGVGAVLMSTYMHMSTEVAYHLYDSSNDTTVTQENADNCSDL